MKTVKKNIVRCLFLSFVISCFMGITVFADTEKIDSVKLTFSCDPVPEAGKSMGTVTVKTTSNEFRVVSAEYTNEVDTWTLGERPEVEVTLEAAEGFRFSYTSSSHFKLSGNGADFVRAKIYDGGDTLILKCYLKRAGGKPEEVYGLEWSGSWALWEASEEDVKSYEVRLFRNKKLVTTITTPDTEYDFRDHITQSGDYTFRVRAIARYEDKTGPWSDYSEENTFTDREVQNYGQGGWVQNQRGWWYRYQNGDYPVNCWKNINGAWYYFDRDGYMLSGWQHINGKWYYLGSSGAMLSGWQHIGGRWYYLGGDGAMLTGWQFIDGYWYYLDGNGAMYADRLTPDGYYVDGSGRRR